MEFDAVVLAGGGSTRFGGVDKALLVLDGISLLDRVLTATIGATSTVVVGPARQTYRTVDWTLEDPPSGGPVAGIAAGVAKGAAPVIVVVSCDLPWITKDDVTRLVEGLDEHDGFGLLDTDGREQRLAAAYRRTALADALRMIGNPRDQSVRRLFAGLDLAWSEPTRAGDDVDTWSDFDD
ncbi:molybdopterin-guanine dinucleotide biosynthesis protein A [Kribbella orskensis]|uniref:Molybdopterin-guanine dinucleotide biosynthesis protein A n=1 Tax=Kribbella orskensis TaxID=2512216 RepID=A0ABY2BP73_9ACTN|nr:MULTISPECIES: molybdenum cofactor guanylyltransferase [Kribbella]TCN39789.1 molybdopterin-guanine dinucleotide biosynthesis protein A [Kribbella sp. VKM Ac-2500]TCO27428.1 molybdopterin-guanine dinucleotide biosynthesis protein A [Kribbella orskensis]